MSAGGDADCSGTVGGAAETTWTAGPQPQHCAEVLDRIYEYIDGEVHHADLDAVRRHLTDCPPCLQQHDVEVALKSLVRRCCQDDRAPQDLRVRILARITEVRIVSE